MSGWYSSSDSAETLVSSQEGHFKFAEHQACFTCRHATWCTESTPSISVLLLSLALVLQVEVPSLFGFTPSVDRPS